MKRIFLALLAILWLTGAFAAQPVQLASPRNPLAFPQGKGWWFNVNHPLAQGTFISAVASGNDFINLLKGKPGAQFSGANAALLPSGPAVNVTGTGVVTFAGLPAVATPSFTFAAIVQVSTIAGVGNNYVNNIATSSSSSVNGIQFGLGTHNTAGNAGVLSLVYSAVGNLPLNISITPGVPYYVFGSCIGNGTSEVVNYVAENLNTGALKTYTGTSTLQPVAGDGNFWIGNNNGQANPFQGYIAAVMFTNVGNTLQAGIQAAQDAYSFWYNEGPAVGRQN